MAGPCRDSEPKGALPGKREQPEAAGQAAGKYNL